MVKNYFKIAFRNLWKNKGYSTINILGLAIGLATCLLITLYVTDELSYDRYNVNADRIYRINADIRFGGGDLHMTQTSDMMGQVLKKDYPQVEEYTRIYGNEGAKLIKKGNEFITEKNIAYVDSTFFNVFTLPAIEGDAKTALNQPNTVVITASTAKKYFNSTNVLGKTIEVKNGETTTPFKITAVIKDIPHNSHFQLDFMLSMKNADYQWGQYTSHNFNTYLLLKKGTDYKAFEKSFEQYITKYVLPYVQQFIKINSMDEFRKSGNKLEYSLIPLTKIHLYSDYSFELSPSGNIQYVYIFSAVALFILIIACINFMNLSTARSASRAKEVGIRKVLGTERKTLIAQFLVESTITAFISLIIAVAIAYFVLPLFNDVAAKSLSVKDLLNIHILPFLILVPFVVGLLAGSYPALFLSGFKPIVVLKGSANTGFKKSNLRNVLVVFQFATSVMLIIGTIIVYSQLHYIQTTKLGFSKDQVLVVDGAYALNNNVQAFKNDVLAMNGVSSATVSAYLPVTNSSRSDNTYSKEAVMDFKNGIDMQTWRIDYDYIKTMGMEIVKGRNFSKEFGSDSSAMLITETTAKLLGYSDPIGKMMYVPSNIQGDNSMIPIKIIGVVKDFHFESLRQNIGPLCMLLGNSTGLISFKINVANADGLIKQIENKWKAMAPGMPFSYRFMDDSFNEMYRSEQRAGYIAITFAVLAIVIACLGLFGLVTYMAEQRTKEIGIRKVLGASTGNVVTMLSKDFLVLVIIACVIAFPVAWLAMSNWLKDYAYRINIEWWVFFVAGFTALAIALITVSFQAIKAALANPVKSLRTE
ncbi:FtsX-like permease family protein [Panacibacter ginsenosidivorans]|uniref:FtsX-like permease family protein n=1 Tax=Panacibacter ginsenosidivorans TaxID=1813871 RepID=A0A5B8V473_9BACT|nr:ABC transporter permease [Panacibacter ginsenosidivorans]QEC65979.1 FtsX-like permease family protein [Panacibacter ginsenosidivorans]